jgi:hypothetical protein
MADVLSAFPRSQVFRTLSPFALRLFDFQEYLEADRLAVFDSDLLFFSAPTEFLRRVEDPAYRLNTFNAEAGFSGYTTTFAERNWKSTLDIFQFDADAVRAQVGFDLQPCVNAGFGLTHRDSIRLDWIEEFLALPGIDLALRNVLENAPVSRIQFFLVEQTLVALCSSRYGVELLPAEYNIELAPGLGDRCFRHYIGTIRHLMYSEGMAQLARDGFLLANRPAAGRRRSAVV